MRIQFALVNPDHVAKGGTTTILTGIAESPILLEDYTVRPVHLSDTCLMDSKLTTRVNLHHTTESLLDREIYSRQHVLEDSFTNLLTLQIWKKTTYPDLVSGEIAFVRTELPSTAPGMHSYAVFGLINGPHSELNILSEKVMSSHTDMQPGTDFEMCNAEDTGIPAVHKIGNSLLNILKQPLWGFGATKYGMSSDISIATAEMFKSNNQHIVEHGVNKPDMGGGSRRS